MIISYVFKGFPPHPPLLLINILRHASGREFAARKQHVEQYSRPFLDQHETSRQITLQQHELLRKTFPVPLLHIHQRKTIYNHAGGQRQHRRIPLGHRQYPASEMFKPSSGKNKRIFLKSLRHVPI
ncbi:hypothetical protein BJH90_16100 [Bacillus halotolerans]|nr:hypothetical protein BJH90_16100 [Bacillus halotolerans]